MELQDDVIPTEIGTRENDYSLNQNKKMEEEYNLLIKDLANCKLKLEIKETAHMQALVKLEVYQKTLAKLSTQLNLSESEKEQYSNEWKKSQVFISMLESEYEVVINQLVETTENNEKLLQTAKELEYAKEESNMHLNVIMVLENAALEKTISTDYYQLELTQAKDMHATKMELMQALIFDERNYSLSVENKAKLLEDKVSDLTQEVEKLKYESFRSAEKEMEMDIEIAMLKSELHKNKSRIAEAEAAEARAKSMQFGLHLAVRELAVEVERAKNEKYEYSIEYDKIKEELDVANYEISGLKNALEEVVKRAEMAENAKLVIEERLRKWREKQRQRRAASDAVVEESNERTSGNEKASTRNRIASLQGGKLCNYVPLGKVLNMKF